MALPKRKLTKAESKKVMPNIKEFNGLAKMLLNLLNMKIQEKEAKIAKISVMVADLGSIKSNHTISIQTIDINDTKVKKQGDYSYNQSMDWEQQIRRQKKGLVL